MDDKWGDTGWSDEKELAFRAERKRKALGCPRPACRRTGSCKNDFHRDRNGCPVELEHPMSLDDQEMQLSIIRFMVARSMKEILAREAAMVQQPPQKAPKRRRGKA
jgi:hypothetical protein